jgi:putative membrane protein
MKQVIWLLKWTLKAAIFFTLFAFALNNQQDAVVNFFFGTAWRAPTVLVVLAAFTLGVGVGVLGMVPRWWRHRQAAKVAQDNMAREPGTDAGREASSKADTEPLTPPAPHGL